MKVGVAMYLAWNEIRRNKLKFGLIIGVIVMISYLLFLLSGLASGLMNLNKEAIDQWEADAIVISEDANQTIQQSMINTEDINNLFEEQAELKELSVIISNEEVEENAFVFGLEEESFLMPAVIEGEDAVSENEVVADYSLKEAGFNIGDELNLSNSDEVLEITGFTDSAQYRASSLLFASNETVEKLNPMLGEDVINAVVVKDENFENVNVDDELEVLAIDEFVENLPGYTPQQLTLNFMIIFLFIISSAVIGIFLYVLTLQKTSLFGVLKAQGFTNGYLARSVIEQTLIVALIGTIIGLGLTLLTGVFLPPAVPIEFDYLTMVIYMVVLIIVAMLGSLFSVISVRKVDPLKAIG